MIRENMFHEVRILLTTVYCNKPFFSFTHTHCYITTGNLKSALRFIHTFNIYFSNVKMTAVILIHGNDRDSLFLSIFVRFFDFI